MRYRRIGNTDLHVSEIALGTVELGLDYGIAAGNEHLKPAEADAIRLLNEAIDLGINFIDTARAYGNSEELIGKALKSRRAEFVLATKVNVPSLRDRQIPSLYKHLRDAVNTSLQMLRTDHIDLLMLHSAPVEVIEQAEEVLEILHTFQREGCVRYLGASVYEAAGSAALQRGGFDCLQIAYSALDRTPEETILPKAAEKGVGVVARSVLLKGVLTSRYSNLPDDLIQLKEAALALDKIAQAADMSLPELAFRYVLSSRIIALCGTARKQELEAAINYANHGRLDPQLIAQIRAVSIHNQRLLNPSNWSIP